MTTVTPDSLIQQLDACLPQTQCRECSYQGCLPYAEAIVNDAEAIDRCAPGGVETLNELARLTKQNPAPFLETVMRNVRAPTLAVIDEAECIGCTKCIQACPVDAIIGASKHMHVILTDECTGCGLCVDPCPVDCIDTVPVDALTFSREKAKQRYDEKLSRLDTLIEKKAAQQAKRLERARDAKRDYIAEAMARVKQKRAQKDSGTDK